MVSCVLVPPQLNFFLNRYKDYMPKGNLSVCTKAGGKTMGPMYYLWPVVPLPLCRNNRKKS